MMWRAAARVRPGERAGWIALAGALAFALSDTLLALHRFRAPVAGALVSDHPDVLGGSARDRGVRRPLALSREAQA